MSRSLWYFRDFKPLVWMAFILAVFLVFLGCENPTGDDSGSSGGQSSSSYSVGDAGPAGGFIFYVDEDNDYDGWTYLEAAPATWAGGTTDSASKLYSGSFTRFPVTSDDLGTGKENTEAISDLNLVTMAVSAAVNASVTNDEEVFDDWYLPSRREIELMYVNLRVNGDGEFRADSNFDNFAGSGEGGAVYWSSTINASKQVWVTNMNPADPPLEDGSIPLNQSIRVSSGDNSFYVRPVRRF